MKIKKIPMRSCVITKEKLPKCDLVRVVRGVDNIVSIDLTGKLNGRGAYLCKNIDCLKMARKNKGLERSFKMSIPNEVYDSLEKEFENLEAE